jgi:pimeloyl-ACP methyl ester carboxylesterase
MATKSTQATVRQPVDEGGGRLVRANGVSLYCEERGTGPAVVGIHGSLSSAAFWSEAAGRLATRGRAIVYDRRGCSRSERPQPYATDVHQQADDAAALIEALDAAPAIVIGRSYGGAVALDLALRYPDRVRALVQLEGDGGRLGPRWRRELAALEADVASAAERGPDAVAETVLRGVGGDDVWDGLPDEVKEMLGANAPALVAELRGGFPERTEEELALLHQPTLLVGGRESLLDYREAIELTAAALPDVRVEWVDGGHLVDPAHPVVLAFVDEVLARA